MATSREINVPTGDVLHQFREDVTTGKLPTISWLVPPEKFSDHPSDVALVRGLVCVRGDGHPDEES